MLLTANLFYGDYPLRVLKPGANGRSRPRGASTRLSQTALPTKTPSEWIEITHPFHPFRGQKFQVLQKMRICGKEALVLKGTTRGSFAVLMEWTDLADPSLLTIGILDFHCLVELTQSLQGLQENSEKGLDP
jgi:hypothetical protein